MESYVLDTGVLVAAIRNRSGASYRVVQAARDGQFRFLVSVPLMFEYESVLMRPEHLAASGATVEDILTILDDFAVSAARVPLVIRTRPSLRDPGDEMVLETAINGSADAIVTFNERDFRLAARRFKISVLQPRDVLHALFGRRT